MSYCTSWWHSFDRSAYGIIESSNSIVETLFPSLHQYVQSMHVQLSRNNLTSDWIIRVVGRYHKSRRFWYFYISATTILWSNAFRTWIDFSSPFLCISVGEFSWHIIPSETYLWELTCWFWLQFVHTLVKTQYSNGIHSLCRQMHWTPGPRLNIKTVLSAYGDFHVKDMTAVRTSYL